jgi:hypothetical protein
MFSVNLELTIFTVVVLSVFSHIIIDPPYLFWDCQKLEGWDIFNTNLKNYNNSKRII